MVYLRHNREQHGMHVIPNAMTSFTRKIQYISRHYKICNNNSTMSNMSPKLVYKILSRQVTGENASRNVCLLVQLLDLKCKPMAKSEE